MKLNFLIAFVLLNLNLFSQQINFADHLKKTAVAKLQNGDSLVYYQCHVDSASQEITTSNGKKIKTKKKRITLTEKFVIYKIDTIYHCKYYNSSITNYPNKKFPYLTLKEVANWEFELKEQKQLTHTEILMFAVLEIKTHAITHYELNINKTCPNEIIIKGKHINEQFIVEGNYILSKSLNY
ncbi:MAG: hypothetical protein C0448_15035 [Sphingobacteriaceae bacterium]|nr:hypothetical protein [Sphingobacteriaceae bacterium]